MIDNVDAAKTEASSRLAVCVAPKIIGPGIEAVLGIRELIRPLIIESKECIGCITAS
jgi:hypothetical protein